MEVFTLNADFKSLNEWDQLLVASNAEFANLYIFESLKTGYYLDIPLSNFQINLFKFYKKMYELSILYNIGWPHFYSECFVLGEIYATYILKSKKKNNITDTIDNKTVYRILNMYSYRNMKVTKSDCFRNFYVAHTYNTNF